MRNRHIYLFLLSFLLFTCDQVDRAETTTVVSTGSIEGAPRFNSDSAYSYIQQQVDFGPRSPNSTGHRNCGDFLLEKMGMYADHVQAQQFNATSQSGENFHFRNIIASFNPGAPRRLLLGAHWDTRMKADKYTADPNLSFDGANDGASGVGVLLEIARLISLDTLKIGIDIIFFDAEDQGGLGLDWCLGSQHWSTNKHKSGYSAYYGVLLDMVGAENATFPHEHYSKQFAPSIVDKVWNEGHKAGFSRYFIFGSGGAIEDDHYYVNVNAKIPMVNIIDMIPDGADRSDAFKSYHHTPDDNMDIISTETLHAVGTTVINLIYRENSLLPPV
ncbi:MAG: glutamine cyclotransferase [Cyclobacteriaceae bacterium]|nr:MAG: glutamine cyclotransferase [Cyclobacteriaceae bacterium]